MDSLFLTRDVGNDGEAERKNKHNEYIDSDGHLCMCSISVYVYLFTVWVQSCKYELRLNSHKPDDAFRG